MADRFDPSSAKPTAQRVAVLPGDGIGPEVTAEAVLVLEHFIAEGLPIELRTFDFSADRFLRDGKKLTTSDVAMLRRDYQAVLLGGFGDPRVPRFEHAEAVVLGLRQGLDLYANVRPCRALSDDLVPLRGRSANDIDLVIFRENTEGAYAKLGGVLYPDSEHQVAIVQDVSTYRGVERIIRAAFEYARAHERRGVCLADKSNALRPHQLYRTVFALVRREFPEISAECRYIDALCYDLIRNPQAYDVVVTNNLFGDILSDLAAALAGGLGLLPSANLHPAAPGHVALFEPVHGSAPDLAGTGRANPLAAIRSVELLLGHLGHQDAACRLAQAVSAVVHAGQTTPDLDGVLTTTQCGAAVRARLS